MEDNTNNDIAILAKNISKTFHITEDNHNTVKQRLFNIFNQPKAKEIPALPARPDNLES